MPRYLFDSRQRMCMLRPEGEVWRQIKREGVESALVSAHGAEGQSRDGVPRRVAQRVMVRPRGLRGWFVASLMVLIFMLPMLVVLSIAGLGQLNPLLLLVWVISVPSTIVLGVLHIKKGGLACRWALVWHGRCAGCGYDLSTGHPEDDGCIVCPECAGAWKFSLLNRSNCPRCRYELAGVPPTPGRGVVCPECGSAWPLPSDGATPPIDHST